MQDFKSSLKKEDLYRQILETTNIRQVYDATDKIQREQAKTGHLRNLARIEIFLSRLREYSGVVEVFVQVKPDILALIWGPIKLILQWASVLKQSFDAVVDTLEEIGNLLPEFTETTRIFEDNARIKEILVLFFKDILDFYLITLQFFSSSRLKFLFESLWPKLRGNIKVVSDLIKRHALLMRSEVHLSEIREADNARRRELEHFQLVERTSTQQEYANIRAHISPKSYDEDLYRLHGSICEGTGKWLFRDKTFQDWIEPSNSASKAMWIKGIPGSGKTFLAATVVSHIKSLSQPTSENDATLFAFLSYKESRTTALSIIQSLIFQMADDRKTIQTALCHSNRQNMRSSLDVAVGLLESLLKCAGLVYLIVDGIDEIEKMERNRLLTQLLRLSEDCGECRILFSCRSESDITALLHGSTVNIELHHRNSGSIQTYVKRRMANWFQERSFLPEFHAEIEGSLAPLAHAAAGMFLYARVVFAIIWEIDSVEELRSLLNCPPASLNDAYGRIFAKVNQSTNISLKNKARKILGWIGCAPSPLTRREIEHALLVNSDADGRAKAMSVLDVVQVCGPIVEVVDGYVLFVHFTAKEYIFHNLTSDYIALSDATLSLTQSCITYLCQGHHDPKLSEEEISGNLLSGAYKFHDFASLFWLDLVKQCLHLNQAARLPQDLVDGLERLYSERSATGGQTGVYRTPVMELGFDALGPQLAHLQLMLENVARFQNETSNTDYHLSKVSRWIHLDPLTTSLISNRIHNQLDSLLCSTARHRGGCVCSTIKQHCGPKAFKCGFLQCKSRRHGFEMRSIRDSHEQKHNEPWKCNIPECEYSSVGFLTRRWRDYHLQHDHRPNGHATSGIPHVSDPDEDEIQPMLFDLVGVDNVEAVAALLPRFRDLPEAVKRSLYMRAVESGSSPLLDLIRPNAWTSSDTTDMGYLILKRTHVPPCVASIEAGNIDTSRWLVAKILVHTTSQDRKDEHSTDAYLPILTALVTCESKEMYDIWKEALMSLLLDNFKVGAKNDLHRFLYPDIITATDNKADRESILILFWREMRVLERLDPETWGDGLFTIASTTRSINLARALLDAGADINWRKYDKSPTPLYQAAKENTEKAAQFMKFLLFRGADSQASTNDGNFEDEDGAVQISRWLGMSWDDLVEKTKSSRERRKNDKETWL